MVTTQSSPLEIDTALAEIYRRKSAIFRTLRCEIEKIHHAVGDQRRAGSEWLRSDAAVEVEARELAKAEDASSIAAVISRIDAARRSLARCDDERRVFDDLYDAAPWSRFYLVTSSDGHIHSSPTCTTCRTTTEFAWLPELSGMAEVDAVTAQGPILCTVCFPTAPTEWTRGKSRATYCAGVPDPGGDVRRAGMRNYRPCTCGYVAMVNTDGSLRKHRPESKK